MGEFHLPTFNFTLRVSLVSQNQSTIINQAPFTESLQLLLLCKPWNIKVHIHFELSLQNKQPEKKNSSPACLSLQLPKPVLKMFSDPDPAKPQWKWMLHFKQTAINTWWTKGAVMAIFRWMAPVSEQTDFFWGRLSDHSPYLVCSYINLAQLPLQQKQN